MRKFTTSMFNDKILSSFVTVLLWTFWKKILLNWIHCNSLNKICVFKSRDFKQDRKVFWWLVKIFWDTEVQTNKQNRFQSRMVIVINRKDIHNIHIVFCSFDYFFLLFRGDFTYYYCWVNCIDNAEKGSRHCIVKIRLW